MSKFVETKDGAFVLSSDVVKVQEDGEYNCTITTSSRQVYSVDEQADELVQDITSEFVCVIPAEPGYFVVEAISGTKKGDAWKPWFIPVVGWSPVSNADEFECLYESSPIIAGQRKYPGSWALVWPDGKVTNTCASSFKSVEEWLDYAKTAGESGDSDD